MRTYYSKHVGDANAICDVCSRKLKTHQLRLRWDGLWTCHEDWEPRHPQDFIRARKESNNLPVVKPRPPDVFTTKDYTAVPDDYAVFREQLITQAEYFRTISEDITATDTVSVELSPGATDATSLGELITTTAQYYRDIMDNPTLVELITVSLVDYTSSRPLNSAPLNSQPLG